MKVLLSAYACEPNRGSEPGIGWNVAKAVAKVHQVWILTSNTHRAAIEAELAIHPIPNLSVIYLDPLGWVYDWTQEGKRAHWDVHLHYYLWQIKAYFVARSLHQLVQFDLVHHITYGKYSSPSFLAFLPIPFLWGPVGGGESAPAAFQSGFSWRGRGYEFFRSMARRLGELDPFVRLMLQRRDFLALATTADTAKRLDRMGAKAVQVFSQVGLPEEDIDWLSQPTSPLAPPGNTQNRFISIGRLLHWKGFHLGLQAFAEANLPDFEYWIVGEGPEKARLQALATQLGIADRVKFWSRLPRQEIMHKLGECLALLHPSLHDSGGWVCLESMAAGCPVICLDLGGPALQVTEETGFKITAQSPNQAVHDLAKAMAHLAKDQDLRLQMGQACQKHVWSSFSWEKRGQLLVNFYAEILHQQAIVQPSPTSSL